MATTDLSDYNLGELKGLQFEVDNEIRKRRRQEVDAARAHIAAIAQESGLSVDDVMRDAGLGAGKARPTRP